MTQNRGPTGSSTRSSSQEFVPSPGVQADVAAAPTLAVPDQDRAPALIEIAFGQSERLVDAQPCSPQEHDQGT
jgi:hypothetical protein